MPEGSDIFTFDSPTRPSKRRRLDPPAQDATTPSNPATLARPKKSLFSSDFLSNVRKTAAAFLHGKENPSIDEQTTKSEKSGEDKRKVGKRKSNGKRRYMEIEEPEKRPEEIQRERERKGQNQRRSSGSKTSLQQSSKKLDGDADDLRKRQESTALRASRSKQAMENNSINESHTAGSPPSSKRRKKYKGWAWLDDGEDVKANNQDQFARIAEEAARSAAAMEEANAGESIAPSRSLRAPRDRRSKGNEPAANNELEEQVGFRSKERTKKKRKQKAGLVETKAKEQGSISREDSPVDTDMDKGQDKEGLGEEDEEPLQPVQTPSKIKRRSRQKEEHILRANSETSALTTRSTTAESSGEDLSHSPKARKINTPRRAISDFSKSTIKPAVDSEYARPSVDQTPLAIGTKHDFAPHASKLLAILRDHESAFREVKSQILSKITGRTRLSNLSNVVEEYQKVHQLLSQTVLAGEGNSMLIIGSRGSGKTTVVENAIADLSNNNREDFHVVRLNGFIHTDDKIALKEIWRQLGRELDGEQEETAVRSNYADTLTSLLALLSHQDEAQEEETSNRSVAAKSIIFILDEFDLFATHPRQTLLYNLFDVAQSHRNAPIAVLGLTTKVNVIDNLEKRVKSRFGQRFVHLSLPPNLQTFKDICLEALTYRPSLPHIPATSKSATISTQMPPSIPEAWNTYASALLEHPHLLHHLNRTYHISNRPIDFITSFLLPIVTSLTPSTLSDPISNTTAFLSAPDSSLHLLSSLTTLQLSLLIAAARLDILLDTDIVSFDAAYAEYLALASKAKVHAAGAAGLGGAGRVWGREVALAQWEGLAKVGLILPATGGGGGRGVGADGAIGAGGGLWRVDVGLEEMGAWLENEGRRGGGVTVGLAGGLGKWCREI